MQTLMEFSWLAVIQEELFICFSINPFHPSLFLEGSRECQHPRKCQLELVIVGDSIRSHFH